MKTTTFLFLSLLLSSVAANPLLSADDAAPVLDTEGNELQTGANYYILPLFRGRGGGLTLASTSRNGTTCPLDVVQARKELDRGLPLTFSPVSQEKVVRESTDLNVKFSVATMCVQSTVWRLDSDESTGQFFVTTGGVEGNPGLETLSNWFKIQKNDAYYKLVFCPTVCDFCKPVCGDLGIDIDESGTWPLVLSDTPFIVMFKKA